ncbi:MAG: DUF4402 domain-containing protein [Bacteroidales bacterium]|jgi:hypothetical protein
MKTSLKLFALGLVLMGFGVNANAQTTTTLAATPASAKIITTLTLTAGTELKFGTFSISATTPGTVVISTAGDRSRTGGVDLAGIDVFSAASYTVGGESGYQYGIVLPESDVTLTSGANTMAVNTFLAHTASAGVDGLTGTLGGSGDTFTVGATLNVPAAKPIGTYSGSFNVTIAYN